MIDLLLAVVLLGYALAGFRQGFVISLLSISGFLGGGALAMWGLPQLMEQWLAPASSDLRRVLVLVVGVLAAALIGQAVGVSIGTRARSRVRARPVRLLDSALGSVASVVAVSLLAWLVAGALRGGSTSLLSRAIGRSQIIAGIDGVVPAGSARVFADFRSLIDAEGFPRVFEGVGPERIRPADAPHPRVAASAGVRAAARGIVKVTGDAGACDRSQEGSGWVVAPGRVVTNAHVVAGVDAPRVQVGGVGRRYGSRVVVFDPARDLAVLAVPDLRAPALRVGSDLRRGQPAVVAGFPLDGPYRLDSARVREVVTARGEDIYAEQRSVRRIYSLYARVRPGNSGGPVLGADGAVVGVVFAKSLDDDRTAYALTASEAEPVLDRAARAERPVEVGRCTRS